LRATSNAEAPHPAAGGAGDLARGRAAYARKAWDDAYLALAHADERAPLAIDDLETLVWAAALSGRDDAHLRGHERLYQAWLDRGEELRAARAAFWLAMRLFSLSEAGRATGWCARAQRLVAGKDCAEAGYLLLPLIRRHELSDENDAAARLARQATEIGDRFREPDLSAFGRTLAGRAAVRQGRIDEGLALFDEAMLSATTDELSPIVTGLIYCSVIASCHNVFALDRAREWTRTLQAWIAAQSQMVPFTGTCAIHRIEILHLGGAWSEAIDAARATAQRLAGAERGEAVEVAGDACYQQAEIHRLRGEHAAADAAYRAAVGYGREAQPGLALLRLAQGRTADAASAIRRVVAATSDRLRRVRYLPASVDIFLAAGDLDDARRAALDLGEIARDFRTDILRAMAGYAHAAIAVHERNAQAAIDPLRRALRVWQDAGAPYIVARVRLLLARACRDVGDRDGAAIEAQLARAAFEEVGAAPDVAAADTLLASALTAKIAAGNAVGAHRLSPRELEVLRLVATGKTNKEIAAELHLSNKTVDRHVSNIFSKIDVASRAAATAYAYRHGLI
jgi:DNA-binding CsgD family transcriptional regulator